jgi:hypothetical protein
MSLIGAVSLTDKQGVFLGSVNLDNLNIDPNQIVYSADGINLEGLNLGAGLEQANNDLITIGNPDIQLTSNSIYCNDNVGSTPVQTAVNSATQSDVIYVSAGSYGESQVVLTNKYNMAINGPAIGTSTICELLNGINIDNTNELIRISNLAIKTSAGVSSSVIKPIGRTIFHNTTFVGSVSAPHTIEIGKGTTKYMTFNQVEFDQYCTIIISDTLSAPVYFINCNFGGATIQYNNASALLVIMNNCSGLVSYPLTTKAILVGLNVLTTGASQVSTTNVNLSTINGSAYPPSGGISIANQATTRIPYETATNNSLNSNANLTFNDSTNTLATPNINATNLTITNINGSAYPPVQSGVVVNNQTEGSIPFCTATSNTLDCGQDLMWFPTQKLLSTNFGLCDCNELTHLQYITVQNGDQSKNNTNRVLTSDGYNGMKWDENGGAYSVLTEHFKYGQQTVQSGSSIPLYAITGLYNKLPNFNCIYSCVFNFSTSSNNCILTLTLDDTVNTPQVYTQSFTNNGHHSIPVNFIMPATGGYDFNFTITGAVDNGTISTDTNDFYNVRIDQVKGAL